MRFTVRKKHLLDSIQEVSNAITPRAAVIPILTGMKLEVLTTKIVLTGSNSDITIQSTIPATIDGDEIITNIEPGSIVLPMPHFPEIIRKLPQELVHIYVDENYKTVIQSGKAVFNLYGQNSEEYPQIAIERNEDDLAINVTKLKGLIRQTVFAVSAMETRPVLTGVHVTVSGDTLTFTATDTHRLAQRSVVIGPNKLDHLSIVIPGKSLQELNKIIDETDENMLMVIMNNQVLFYTDNLTFISRLLSGTYPDTDRLIPTNTETTLHIQTKELIQTLERAALLANNEQNNVIRLDADGDKIIEISSNSPEIGNVQEQLAIISHEGEPVKISFSSRYLLDSLKTIDSETVQINFTGAMRPFIIRTPKDNQALHLILPVRTY